MAMRWGPGSFGEAVATVVGVVTLPLWYPAIKIWEKVYERRQRKAFEKKRAEENP